MVIGGIDNTGINVTMVEAFVEDPDAPLPVADEAASGGRLRFPRESFSGFLNSGVKPVLVWPDGFLFFESLDFSLW